MIFSKFTLFQTLKAAKINLVHESPNVGTNLRDHLQAKLCYQDKQWNGNTDMSIKMLPC